MQVNSEMHARILKKIVKRNEHNKKKIFFKSQQYKKDFDE